MMKNCSERCARVFRIKIDLTRNERIVRQVSAKIELAIDLDVVGFEHLRNDFSQQNRLCEIL